MWTGKITKASDQHFAAADSSLEQSVAAPVVENAFEPAVTLPAGVVDENTDALDIDSDMDTCSATTYVRSECTQSGDEVEPPPPDDDFGGRKMHPCMQ